MFTELPLTLFSTISLFVLIFVYYFLITEKLNKVLVAGLGALMLIIAQVFRSNLHSSQENAVQFIAHNLDILGFVVGMMILIGIVKDSGLFEALAIWLVKKINGNPYLLLIVVGYLTLSMTVLFSNIPTILIVAPIVLILVKELKLPIMPYLFVMVSMANLAGAATPISDPTTYYQAKTVGLSFYEVISNSGIIVAVLSVVVTLYSLFIFRKQLKAVQVKPSDVSQFRPSAALRNKRVLYRGTPILIAVIVLMVLKDQIHQWTGLTLDNATLTLTGAFLCMLIFHREPKKVFMYLIDWEILFFFMGLFVIVGSLEFTQIIEALGKLLLDISGGSIPILTFLITVGSGILSTFIDNVPYNITMVAAIQAMEKTGIVVYPLWWALNLGTSIGGAGSPIAAACNVIAFGQAEKEGHRINFAEYLKIGIPLVLLNSLITFILLWLKFLS
jgi:Na+/H+ antiporter NhaD/arsenite permease-like protein